LGSLHLFIFWWISDSSKYCDLCFGLSSFSFKLASFKCYFLDLFGTICVPALAWEFAKFIFYRVLSFGMDMACMYLFIDMLHTGNLIAKIITQIVVVVANYIFSKVFIFKKVEIIEDEKTNSSPQ
jgi:hypothetical protein